MGFLTPISFNNSCTKFGPFFMKKFGLDGKEHKNSLDIGNTFGFRSSYFIQDLKMWEKFESNLPVCFARHKNMCCGFCQN